MTRSLILRLVPLAALICTLTACPTAANHVPPIPTGGLSAAEVAAQQQAPSPLASGASPFVRPALIQASAKDDPTPSPSPELTPSPTAAPVASTSPLPSGSPTATPTAAPSGIGLLGPGVGPSPINDPTARFFPSTKP